LAIESYWSGEVGTFLRTDPRTIGHQLAHESQRRFRVNEAQQLRAWSEQCVILANNLRNLPRAQHWYLLFEVSLPRTDRRADAVLLIGGTIVVLEFKVGLERIDNAARAQVEDFALDLQDFHAGSHGRRIVPVVVATAAMQVRTAQIALPIGGVEPVADANPDSLETVLRGCVSDDPVIDPRLWQAAPYRPVPPIIEAARSLYARHNVEEIVDARAGAVSLASTSAAIREALLHAQAGSRRVVLFVTGVPGAGKTLCGLNACFGAADDALRATFLTGNPSLVHVLREALVRDAVKGGMDKRAAAQRMSGVIQKLPSFRDRYAAHDEVPAERVVVIDEAQRSWSRDYAIRKSRDRDVPLSDSEPAHLLAAMARHTDWCAVVCLIGNGQEIHDGEGGLAEWGVALGESRDGWQVVAAPDCLTATEARRRLPALAGLRTDARLHLTVPTRQIGHPTASDWVDAVLQGDARQAHAIAQPGGESWPYLLTRDLDELRVVLRRLARGSRRAGLVASSGARRLRAVGLGAELPHMDAGDVARWFLDRWPDVRASDALELVATEFAVQGLELDVVGLCWDADLVRVPGQSGWRVRAFVGSKWQIAQSAEGISNRVNTYRVLLTRARHETVIFVPRGDAADGTRDPAVLDGIAAFLVACGVRAVTVATLPLIEVATDLFGAVA
jgi:hypothetical protein